MVIIIIICIYFIYLRPDSNSIVVNYGDSAMMINNTTMTMLMIAMMIVTVLHIIEQKNQTYQPEDIFSLDLIPKSSFGTPYKHVSTIQQ
jgi:hypothetical protein